MGPDICVNHTRPILYVDYISPTALEITVDTDLLVMVVLALDNQQHLVDITQFMDKLKPDTKMLITTHKLHINKLLMFNRLIKLSLKDTLSRKDMLSLKIMGSQYRHIK